jgi:hypothetical protein
MKHLIYPCQTTDKKLQTKSKDGCTVVELPDLTRATSHARMQSQMMQVQMLHTGGTS